MKQNSGIVLPVIFFIIFPVVSIALFVPPNLIAYLLIQISFYSIGLTSADLIQVAQMAYLGSFFSYVYYLAIPSLVANYGIYGYVAFFAFFSMDKYSRRKGNANLVIEFEFVKRLLVIETCLLVIGIIINLLIPKYFGINIIDTLSDRIGHAGFFRLVFPPSMYFLFAFGPVMNSAVAVFLRILTLMVKKEFRFYFAKGCCELMSEDGDDVHNIKFLSLLFESCTIST